MKIEFDKKVFKEWFELNGFSRNGVITAMGQRDPNKVGRWMLGQVIATEDLIKLCNHYNLELGDFFIIKKDDEGGNVCISTSLPDTIKDKRLGRNGGVSEDGTSSMPTTDAMSDSEIALARLSLKYEKKMNDLMAAHSLEIKENNAKTYQQLKNRNDIIATLQNTINVLNENMKTHNKEIEELQNTIATLNLTIQQQQGTIATYDAIIRKQKKIPSQPSPLSFGQVTMVQDGGGAVSAAPTINNDNNAVNNNNI